MDRVKTTKAVKALVKLIGGGFVLSAGLVAPNILILLEPFLGKKENAKPELNRLIRHMERIGLIEKQLLIDGNTYITLTNKGKHKLKQAELEDVVLTDDNKWNGTWHIVTFDIPAKNRKQRNEVSYHLKRLGLYNFQRSLWAYPYVCETEVQIIANALGANRYFVYMQAKLDDSQHKKLLEVFSTKLSIAKLSN